MSIFWGMLIGAAIIGFIGLYAGIVGAIALKLEAWVDCHWHGFGFLAYGITVFPAVGALIGGIIGALYYFSKVQA